MHTTRKSVLVFLYPPENNKLAGWQMPYFHDNRPARLGIAWRPVPGRAWLQWEAVPDGDGTQLVQTALFEPYGLSGQLYWNLLYPVHKLIFSGLVHAIADLATSPEFTPR